MQKKGLSADQLAQALAEPGFGVSDALRAVNNWTAGRDHPRCKAKNIRKIAELLSVRTADISKFTSEYNNHRGSPRKAKLLIDLIRGKSVTEAENLLTFTQKRAGANIKRALLAARTEAELADADTGKTELGDRRVDDAHLAEFLQQSLRDFVRALIDGDFLTHEEDAIITVHFFAERHVERIPVGDHGHGRWALSSWFRRECLP
jgi:large subunit ribosomal protein L22